MKSLFIILTCLGAAVARSKTPNEQSDYPNCKNKDTEILYSSDDTKKEWGEENDDWCIITDLQRCPNSSDGYPCCPDCNVVYTDENNQVWGNLNDEWCSIPYRCSSNSTEVLKSDDYSSTTSSSGISNTSE
ncbi:hypothetical protein H8356DRAFT_1018259, partial [Neocallimastix lanati (nom. inval.)]